MRRKCDGCGRERELKNGATCERGHFFCSSCAEIDGILPHSSTRRRECPIDRTRLR